MDNGRLDEHNLTHHTDPYRGFWTRMVYPDYVTCFRYNTYCRDWINNWNLLELMSAVPEFQHKPENLHPCLATYQKAERERIQKKTNTQFLTPDSTLYLAVQKEETHTPCSTTESSSYRRKKPTALVQRQTAPHREGRNPKPLFNTWQHAIQTEETHSPCSTPDSPSHRRKKPTPPVQHLTAPHTKGRNPHTLPY